jgi:hypothetical protein
MVVEGSRLIPSGASRWLGGWVANLGSIARDSTTALTFGTTCGLLPHAQPRPKAGVARARDDALPPHVHGSTG